MKFSSYFLFILLILNLYGCASTSTITAQANVIKVKQADIGVQITSEERLLFNTNKYEIKEEGAVFMNRIAKILKEKSKANVLIEGHTDNVGNEKYNITLSLNRANAVKNYLIQTGIEANRIKIKALGMSMPVADNSSTEGRQLNRRTEIVLLGETLENIGGYSLAAKLQDGLLNFINDTSNKLKGLVTTS